MMPQPPPDESVEDAFVPVSALQHYLFCPRQCALIHVERIWTEDGRTAEGRILHDRVDHGRPDRRRDVRTVRGLPIRSLGLGLIGKADAVEFHGAVPGAPYPVEYKRGRPKGHRADEVQLCAQAMCLEEMFSADIAEGALFYGETRRRTVVAMDAELRDLTARTAAAVRAMIAKNDTPLPVTKPGCRHCSLRDDCRPERIERAPDIASWLARQVAAVDRDCEATEG
jgi:CRISPR-associated exonuclease Cas4